MAVLIMGFRLVLSDFGKSARKQVLLLFGCYQEMTMIL